MYGMIIALLVTGLFKVTDAGKDKQPKKKTIPLIPPVHIDVNDSRRRYSFEMKKVTVSKTSIKKIKQMKPPFGHIRKIRSSQRNKIKQLLLLQDIEGNYIPQHFESPIVLEKTNSDFKIHGQYRIIDGNHRYDAMVKALNKLPKGSSISFFAAIYDFNGMDDKEKQKARQYLFRKWNSGLKQSTHDYIESCQDEIKLFPKIAGWDLMTEAPLPERIIPCTVYGDTDFSKIKDKASDTLKFKDFIGGYFAGIRSDGKGRFMGGYTGNAQEFVADCVHIFDEDGDEELKRVARAWNIICSVWGMKSPYHFKKNELIDYMPQYVTRTTPFYALMRIILQNEKETDDELITRLQNSDVDKIIRYRAKYGGRESCRDCHEELIAIINNGYSESEQFYPTKSQDEIDKILEELPKIKDDDDTPDVETTDVEEENLDDDDKDDK